MSEIKAIEILGHVGSYSINIDNKNHFGVDSIKEFKDKNGSYYRLYRRYIKRNPNGYGLETDILHVEIKNCPVIVHYS